MTHQIPVEIGGSEIDLSNAHAVMENVRYLVRHEGDFAPFQAALEDLASHDRLTRSQRAFLDLVRGYRAELASGSVHASEWRDRIAGFEA